MSVPGRNAEAIGDDHRRIHRASSGEGYTQLGDFELQYLNTALGLLPARNVIYQARVDAGSRNWQGDESGGAEQGTRFNNQPQFME